MPPRFTFPFTTLRQSRVGFSLFELLISMAVIGLLATFSVPAFNAIGSAQTVTQGVYDVSALLELARKEAMTRQTYVWVGFQNANVDGNTELRMAAVGSRDGTDNHSTSGNLMNLTRVLRVKNVALSEWSELKADTKNLHDGVTPSSVAANAEGISFSVGNANFNGPTITFTPGGQAMLKGAPGLDGGYDPLIEVSFRQSRGEHVTANADDAAVFLNGSTGTPRVLRLQ